MTEVSTGGCQCGAVRYRIEGPLGTAGFCHCRMCQKAFGSLGAPLVSVPRQRFRWTRGEPTEFRSSPIVARGFCRDCGTPLYMSEDGDSVIEIAIGTLDDPAAAAPDHVVGIESKLPWADRLPTLPAHSTAEDRTPGDLAKLTPLQHPDHDTADWPPKS
jgi:hypothetical protein